MPIFIINTLDHEQRTVTVQNHTPEAVADALHIPVIAEIEPRPDPVYGHTFPWPEEVEQFLAQLDEGGGQHA